VFVLEYCEDESLWHILNHNKKPFSYEYAIEVVRQVVAGMTAVHDRGIMHRDLKLENVLASSRGLPYTIYKIADFGFSTSKSMG
jgi:serine/threonine protein kinase